MTPFAPVSTLRRTALGTSALVTLALAAGLSALAADAWAKPKVPLPQPRPIARNVAPNTAGNTAPAANTAAKTTAATAAPAVPALAPATRQHAALPPARNPPATAAVAATSSTSPADTEALENVIELVRKHKPADATQAQAAISDPV
ncbi:MAG TPA: lytic transglycosylase domain-containing protein, partial [Bradyrhizobium sp.]|nr:lytic transglycosylase domain-containing protein [Bradyrhizobium sp.]